MSPEASAMPEKAPRLKVEVPLMAGKTPVMAFETPLMPLQAPALPLPSLRPHPKGASARNHPRPAAQVACRLLAV
jgi:hypothetical protein